MAKQERQQAVRPYGRNMVIKGLKVVINMVIKPENEDYLKEVTNE